MICSVALPIHIYYIKLAHLTYNAPFISVKLPRVDYDPAIDNKLVNEEEKHSLEIHNWPTSTTYGIFEKYLVADKLDSC